VRFEGDSDPDDEVVLFALESASHDYERDVRGDVRDLRQPDRCRDDAATSLMLRADSRAAPPGRGCRGVRAGGA
jgi:hypothetical protein